MSEFVLSDKVDNEKCFVLNRSEIEKRLDPFYYIPSIKKLEEEVKSQGAVPLRTFVENISSGATPKTSEKERYYSDKVNGIPFLRVQNLSYTGFLKLDNCKYINEETHNNYLKRSQVSGGDLLVKITGVGRMAVASVAPDGFVGNTNQHMVVIKTKDRKTSEILASYLNTDIGEMLASRRATGGTRPALDYPALLSIPIIFDNKILEIYKKAIESKKQKEKQAKELLESIDIYFLRELGITLPEVDDSLEERIFEVKLSEIAGSRFDGHFYTKEYKNITQAINNSKYSLIRLKDKCTFIAGYAFKSSDYTKMSSTMILTIKNIFKNSIKLEKVTYVPNSFFQEYKKYAIHKNDLLIAMTGATIGKVGLFDIAQNALLNQRNGIIRSIEINTKFLMNLLNIKLYQKIILMNAVGGAQPNISETGIVNLKIPLPPIEKQNEIAKHIENIRDEAKQLNHEAKQELENAKLEVEKMILGQ